MQDITIKFLLQENAELEDELLSDPDNQELKDKLFENLKELEDLGYETM